MTALTANTYPADSSLIAPAAISLAAICSDGRGGEMAHGSTRPAPDFGDVCATLQQTELFAELTADELRDLAQSCIEQRLPARAQVFRRGSISDAVFVLCQGDVVVLRDQRGRPVQILARLGPGDLFGELGVLHDSERGATVRTTEPCRLLRIEKSAFLTFLENHSAVAAKLERMAAWRHCKNARAALDVDTRTDVRIRVDAEVTLVAADGRCRPAILENVSRSGLALTGVPADWGSKSAVAFTLIGGSRQLDVAARVAWRQDDTVGLQFTGGAASQGHRLSLFTRRLLETLR